MKNVKKILFPISVSVVLSGCLATTSDAQLRSSATLHYYSRMCAHVGMLDQETAAKGIALANNKVYSQDSARYQATAKEMFSHMPTPTKEQCEDTKLNILTAVEAKKIKNSNPVPSSTYKAPTQTNCMTIYGTTHCTTY